MVQAFEDVLNNSRLEIQDGAVIKAGVFTTIAEYQVTPAELARMWGYTEWISATQTKLGEFLATLQDATPTAITDNAIIRLTVKNKSESRDVEVWRTTYGKAKNGVELTYKEPGAKEYSYLAIEVMLPPGAADFTLSAANSSISVSTTLIQE